MNWFKGEISEAIVASKQKQSIFVVFVEGKNEMSLEVSSLVNKAEIAGILNGDQFVAIKIEAESVPYQQFSQIYKQVPVPSLYFIGKQGVPLEIVTEPKDVQTLCNILAQVLQKGGYSTPAQQSENLINSENTQTPSNVVCENGVCTIKKNEPSTSRVEDTPAANTPDLSAEEKVERAKQLIEKKRDEKQREENQKERQSEIDRRKMGQNMQQLKRWQDEEELKNLLEERQKEKLESQKARDRVLAQIAQDKAERAAKFSPVTTQPQTQAVPSTSARAASASNTARLQFRLPDGQTATQDFSSGDSLEVVHQYIRANLNLSFNYTLSTTFPRREFGASDASQNLRDLGLVPTAVILILPVNKNVVTAMDGNGFSGLIWTLLTPVFALFGYLKTFIFGAGNAPSAGATGANKRTEPRAQPQVRRGGETTVVKRQGNVHRLSNKNDSDEDNNTWNGNSTQQM